MLERSSGDGSGRGVVYKERGLEDQGRISDGPSSGVSSGRTKKRLPSSARRHHSHTRLSSSLSLVARRISS